MDGVWSVGGRGCLTTAPVATGESAGEDTGFRKGGGGGPGDC